MVEVVFIRSGLSEAERLEVQKLLTQFCGLIQFTPRKIILDCRKTKDLYKTDGLFGGFKDLYNERTRVVYFNPNHFIEFQKGSAKNLAHLGMHELVHAMQIATGLMVVHSPNKLEFNGKIYDRAPFSLDLFNKIRDMDGALGEEYHWRALPWEKSAYQWPKEFMGQPLWRAYS